MQFQVNLQATKLYFCDIRYQRGINLRRYSQPNQGHRRRLREPSIFWLYYAIQYNTIQYNTI